MERPSLSMARAGELFTLLSWIQGQINDLLIFRRHPALVEPFLNNPEVMPAQFVDLRVAGWQKYFQTVVDEFLATFADQLHEKEIVSLQQLVDFRNIIGHAHYSLARDYLLYRPNGGEAREAKLIERLGIKPREGATRPALFKLDLSRDDVYLAIFNEVVSIDEHCLGRIATTLGLKHSRIR